MFLIEKNISILKFRKKYFYEKPGLFDYFSLVKFINPGFEHNCLLIKTKKKTVVNRLDHSVETILENYSSNLRNEIKRADKEGVSYTFFEDKSLFVNFYNSFAEIKRLKKISINDLIEYGDNLVITKASVASDNLAMHAYYIDNEERYICLIYSCSLRLGLTENKSLIGWANKGLHHFDMIKFRERGIQKYDWGGICEDNSNSDELNIRKFKLSFGGSRGEINVFRSFTIYLLEILKEVFK